MSENRADSVNVQADIMKKSLEEITPPIFLEEKEMRFWKSIINARLNWTEIDLIQAANLARCLCSIEEETMLLKIEGSVLKNQKGTQVMNPRHVVLEQLTRRMVCLAGKIHVHALATQGEAKLAAKKNTVKHQAIQSMNEIDDDDDLIAKPLH